MTNIKNELIKINKNINSLFYNCKYKIVKKSIKFI